MKNQEDDVIVGKVKIDPDSFCPFRRIAAQFRVTYDAQYDGHGVEPTFEDKLDESLAKLKSDILKQMPL